MWTYLTALNQMQKAKEKNGEGGGVKLYLLCALQISTCVVYECIKRERVRETYSKSHN